MRFTSLFSNILSKRFHLALTVAVGFFLFLTVLVPPAKAITISPPRLELEADPGTVVDSEFKVTNDSSDQSINYYTQVENFEAKDETGAPQFVQTPEGLAVWIDVDKSVRIGPGESKTIPFKIKVPRNAEPGGYFASIFVRTTPPAAGGGEVSIGTRLGTLVLLRVNGEIQEGVDILEFSTKDKHRFFNRLPIELYYRFQNIGTDRVKPEGDIIVKNIFGLKAKVLSANRSEGSVLPRSIRRFDTAWINGGGGQEDSKATVAAEGETGFIAAAGYQWEHFALGYYTANLDIRFGENNNTASGKFRFFVFPWQLITIFLGVLIVGFIILRFAFRRYNRFIISKHQGK